MSQNQAPGPQADLEPGEEPWWFPMARACEFAFPGAAHSTSQADFEQMRAEAFGRMDQAARREAERAGAWWERGPQPEPEIG